MEKKDIIENGLLEAYLLGDLGQEENALVEQALMNDSELRSVYSAMEKDMEVVARQNAITPPPIVKERLFRELELEIKSSAKSKPVKVNRMSATVYLAVAASLAILFMPIWSTPDRAGSKWTSAA